MLTNLALQLVTRGPSFLEQLRRNFDGEEPRRPSRASPRHVQQQEPLQYQSRPRFEEVEMEIDNCDAAITVGVKREPEMNVAGRRDHDPAFADGAGDINEELLPDVPPIRRVANDDDADVGHFRVPDVPPLASGPAKKERAGSKSRNRSGKSPARSTSSSSRKNANRKSEESAESPMAFSDASDFVESSGDEMERTGKGRDANANNVKARGRRPAGSREERDSSTARDRSKTKTKIPKPSSSKEMSTTSSSSSSVSKSSLHDNGFNDEDDLLLLSSDDEEVRAAERRGKTTATVNAGHVRQRKQNKKKPTSPMVVNEDSVPYDC